MGYACWWSIIDIAMKLDMISEEEAERQCFLKICLTCPLNMVDTFDF